MAIIYPFPPAADVPEACPLHGGGAERCRAAGSSRPTAGGPFCASEDYDACPVFLAYMLRRSRPKCHASRSRELAFK